MTETLIRQVQQYIEANHLIQQGDAVIAGVSGGADSMCLLALLSMYRETMDFSLHVVHVEHGIRGAQSLSDAAYVRQFCTDRAIPCEIVSVDACGYARAHGYSVEEAARILRYDAFETFAKKLEKKYSGQENDSTDTVADAIAAKTTAADMAAVPVKIAVAHHREDQAETVLWQLVRGSDLKGIGGMRARRGRLIRPLLDVERRAIEAFLTEQSISWREDATNADTAYTRNRLRLDVLPVLKQLNAQAVRHLCESAARAQEAEEYLALQADALYERLTEPTARTGTAAARLVRARLLYGALEAEPVILQRRVIYRAICECAGHAKDIEAKHVAGVQELFSHQVGQRIHLPYGLVAERTYDGVQLLSEFTPACGQSLCGQQKKTPGTLTAKALTQAQQVHMEVLECVSAVEISKKKYTKCFDYDKIEHHVQIRTRQAGDYLTIDGAGHHQKLKSYFVNEKIPARERDQLLLLADGSHIMWVIGHRISDYYKVNEHTKRILKVQYSGGKENE